MAKSRLLPPIWYLLGRPLALQSRNAFISTSAALSARVGPPPTGSAPARRRPAPEDADTEAPPNLDEEGTVRLPRSVQALYLQPLRRVHRWGVPTCDLQMRSYSVPNLEFFCDFALRAAYYLKLPTYGPVPLPRMIERWTVPKSPFIFKKSQENFERITVRRLIQIRDGHPQSVQIWLAFLQKHAYYGIGMKANIWEYSKIDFGEQLDAETKSMQEMIKARMQLLGRDRTAGTVEKAKELLESERMKHR